MIGGATMAHMTIKKELLSKLGDKAYNELAEAIDKSELSVFERIEDKFERRLSEEMSTQLRWIIVIFLGVISTQTALILGFMYFLHNG